jgi:peptide/nickel transport system substrate-binding protein
MKTNSLSTWALNVSPSPTLAVDAKAKALKAEGEDVCGFGAGEPDFDTPEFIKEACAKALADGKTKYAPAAGLPALCELLAKKYVEENGLAEVRPAQVVVSPGGKYSCYLAILATCSPGDEVIVPAPYWVSYPEMVKLAGYGKDLAANRAEAQRLLKEAGQEGMSFELHNRGVDQPYKVLGVWLIDQWKQIGLKVSHRVQPSGPFYDTLRKKHDFDVSIDFNCQSVINPIADITKFLGSAGNNYGQYDDEVLEYLYDKIARSPDPAEQRSLIRLYEDRALSEMMHVGITLWWYKINPHRSYVKGWNIAPSHYLNQHLDNVWLDK